MHAAFGVPRGVSTKPVDKAADSSVEIRAQALRHNARNNIGQIMINTFCLTSSVNQSSSGHFGIDGELLTRGIF